MASAHRVLPFSSATHPRPAQPVRTPGYGCEPLSLESVSLESLSLHGPSPAMARLRSQIRRVAPHFRTALLTGEAGTGGEAVARALHGGSPFRHKPLKILSAAAAELRFASHGPQVGSPAHGVFFLREIEQLSPAGQLGLLRLTRLRGARAGCVIALARHDLRALVSAGSFSAELAGSLSGLRLTLPSLRERREDLPTLLNGFASLLADELGLEEPTLAADFLAAATAFHWPRNLDQMEESMRWLLGHRMKLRATELHAVDFEAACQANETASAGMAPPVRMVRLEQLMQEHVRAVLLACNGNKLRAAEVLGISRSTLYRMLDAALPASMLSLAG